LYSARDPGAVGHAVALIEAFQRDGRFDVVVTASGVALRMLRDAGVSARPFSLADGREYLADPSEDPAPLLAAARQVLEEIRPDAVVSSLSSFGIGVDEALLATAGVPTFAMQDFWGDVNLGLKAPAGLYLTLDEEAARLTEERWGARALAVGSPKHSRYAGLDIAAVRRDARASIGVNDLGPLVGFFGQAPDIPGHEEAFRALLRAVTRLVPQPRLLLREHPKFTQHTAKHMSIAQQAGLSVFDVTAESSVERWLVACDVVATSYSACALDHAYLSAFSPEPIGVVLYLLCNPEIQAFMRDACGFDRFPTVKKGIGLVAESPGAILPLLQDALTPEGRGGYFEASKRLGMGDPCRTVMETVASSVTATVQTGGSGAC
jgi:hypothetical protein